MDDAKPSLARRALAVLVLVVAAIVLFRIALGVLSAVFWIVAVVVLVVAALWAMSTLRSARRARSVRDTRTPAVSRRPGAAGDGVEAEMRRIEQQLRDQGRL